MFTGIIEYIGKVHSITGNYEKYLGITLPVPVLDIQKGESISLNGICLTVETFTENTYTCYASAHTVTTTNLAHLNVGSYVNLERALLPTTRLGGHFVTGHIDTTTTLLRKQSRGDALVLSCSLPQSIRTYIVQKGSVAVQGISLTVSELAKEYFTLTIIPETQKSTTIQYWKEGEILNIEVDILAKYVERSCASEPSITESFLQEHGFWK